MRTKLLVCLFALCTFLFAESGNLLKDGTFELEGAWSGQFTPAEGRTGKGIQLLKSPESKVNCDAISAPFNVIPGTDYTLSGYHKGETLYTYCMFRKKDGKSIAIHRGHNGTKEWKEFTVKGKVPEDAVSAYVILRTFSTTSPTFVDDICFLGEKQKGMMNLLANGDFETRGASDGADKWRGSFTRAEGEGIGGGAAARTLNVNKRYSEANSLPFQVRGGAPFQISGYARGKANGTVYAFFTNKEGKHPTKYAGVPASDKWRPFTLSGTVPDDAVSCSVLLRSTHETEPLFFDNVTFESINPIDESLEVNGITITVPPDASPDELTAREELMHYLPLVMKGSFSIGGVPLKKILIGRAATAVPSGQRDESWAIVSKGDSLNLAGIGPRGTLYATYHFLEDQLGIHWWNASEDFVPAPKAIALPALNAQGTPYFIYRDIFRTSGMPRNLDGGRWPARNRLNRSGDLPFQAQYGGAYTYGPPYFVHTFARYIHRGYYKTNPEFFSLVDGKRNGEQYSGQLCLTNPALRAKLIELVKNSVRNSRQAAAAKGVCPPVYYDLSMNDGSRFCECENCLKLEKATSITDVLLDFVNEIADGVGKEYPDVLITTLAYGKTVNPPVGGIRPRDNVVIRLCNPSGSFLSINEPRCKAYKETVQAWAKICKHLTCWEYDIWTYPFPNEFGFAELAKFYAENHFDGLFFEKTGSEPLSDCYEMKAWLLAKVLENPDCDLEALRQTYINGYYGAAAPFIDQYRKGLAQAEKASDTSRKINRYFADNYDYITLDTLLKSYSLFEQAKSAVADNPVLLGRVVLARAPLDKYLGRMVSRLVSDWKKRGRKTSEFPVDRDRLAADLRKYWLPYAKLFKDNDAKAKQMEAEVSIMQNMGTEAKPVSEPPAFKGKTVRHFTPSSLNFYTNPNMSLVKDPDAREGCAFEVIPEGPRQNYFKLPFEAGCYDRIGAKTTLRKRWTDVGDSEGYQWLNLGKHNLYMKYYIYLTGSWEIQAHLDQYLELGAKDLDIWIRVKFVGPLYHKNSKATKSRIYVDSISLVEL